jgi:hypothetical protein
MRPPARPWWLALRGQSLSESLLVYELLRPLVSEQRKAATCSSLRRQSQIPKGKPPLRPLFSFRPNHILTGDRIFCANQEGEDCFRPHTGCFTFSNQIDRVCRSCPRKRWSRGQQEWRDGAGLSTEGGRVLLLSGVRRALSPLRIPGAAGYTPCRSVWPPRVGALSCMDSAQVFQDERGVPLSTGHPRIPQAEWAACFGPLPSRKLVLQKPLALWALHIDRARGILGCAFQDC